MNRQTQWHSGIRWAVLGVALIAVPTLFAQEADEERVEIREERIVQIRTAGKTWIGVMTQPAGDALRSHLALPERLIVERVMDESPASKAGLKEHDILVRFGDSEIHSLEDLVEAIDKQEKKEAELVVIREGKEKSLRITPADPPLSLTDRAVDLTTRLPLDAGALRNWIESRSSGGENSQSRQIILLGPGILAGGGGDLEERDDVFVLEKALKGLKLQLHQEGDEPARITVEQGDRKWEVDSQHLEDLPEVIRPQIEMRLHRWKGEDEKWRNSPTRENRLDSQPLRARVRFERVHEEEEHDDDDDDDDDLDDALEDLRDEVKALRDDIRSLRKELTKN